jgi:plasmid maintenance system antidote protein VapI
MKKMFLRAKEYWLNLMRSTQIKMSRGAVNISKVITSAHGDQWRKKDVKK